MTKTQTWWKSDSTWPPALWTSYGAAQEATCRILTECCSPDLAPTSWGTTGAVWKSCPAHWEHLAHLIIIDELFLHHLHGINALGFLQSNQQHFGIAAPSNHPEQIKILQAQTGGSFATFPNAHCLWIKMHWNEEAALPVSATAKVSISNKISKLIETSNSINTCYLKTVLSWKGMCWETKEAKETWQINKPFLGEFRTLSQSKHISTQGPK